MGEWGGQHVMWKSLSRSSFLLRSVFVGLFVVGGFLYRGKTRKPEKVEYCHPPTRFPFSSFRYTLSSFSSKSRTPLVAASRVTSLSPAKAEITGLPFNIKFTCRTKRKTHETRVGKASSLKDYIRPPTCLRENLEQTPDANEFMMTDTCTLQKIFLGRKYCRPGVLRTNCEHQVVKGRKLGVGSYKDLCQTLHSSTYD